MSLEEIEGQKTCRCRCGRCTILRRIDAEVRTARQNAEQHRLRVAADAERARILAAERARGRTAFEYGVWS